MAHLLRSVLYPNGEPSRAAQVGSSSSSNPDLGRRFPTGSSSGGAGVQSAQPNRSTYNNPPVYFTQDPEVEEAAPSVFVADSILRGFDLNNAAPETSSAPESSAAGKFVPGPHSGQAGSAASVAQDYDEEILSQPMVPYVGLTFDDIEEAKEVYNNYAYKLGFGTHIGNTKYSTARHAPKGTILSRVFECVHAGKPFDGTAKTARSNSEGFVATDMSSFSAQKSKGKQAKEQMDVKDTRQRNIVLRHDCKAHMVVGMRAGVWTVTVFNAEHTHPMVSMVGRRRFYRSHRKVPEEDFQLLQTLHNQNISTSKIMGALADVRGGDVRGLPYVKRDVSNIRTMLREAVTLRDVSLTVEYFERRKAENPNFFYATQLDENNAVRALFWVDGRTRSLYHKYKDCVFFDTTFCTNRYNMPFAPIVGINNHTQTIVLGCALLPDESIETFRWVFERWMMAMDNMAPENIMTDQDKAMATAISKVFPNATHRCCFYHVLSLARKKLGPNLREGNPFADAFYSCIYGTDTPEEFELCWQHMLQVYGMNGNTHLENMWGSRKTWAPVYFRHNFFPFTSTTGRSEGLNSYFKTLVRPGESVFNFVQQYELCQNLMLDREDNSGFIMETTTAPLWGSWSIEKQAVLFYTREVFDRFQKMLQMSTGFYPLRTELEELCFDLVPNPGLDVRTYRVQVGLEEETYTCGCNQFEMCGLICPHIIRVIVHMNVRSIPEKYMLHRWSMAATTPVPDPGSTGGKFGVPVNNTLKYNSLCRKLNSLAADSCIADDTYAIVLDMVDEAKKVVAAMHRARIAGQQGQGEEHGDATDPRSSNVHHEQQQHGSNLNQQQQEQPVAHETPSNSNLRNPTRVKPKGRPKEKEQRRKPLVELRDEANKKRKKKAEEPKVMKEPKPKRQYRKKKCPFCNEEGHTLKECEYMVLAKQFKDAKDSQPEKTV